MLQNDFDADEHNKLIESVLNDQDSQVITLEGVLIGGHTYELSETKHQMAINV